MSADLFNDAPPKPSRACKLHNGNHPYVTCPKCSHQFCAQYWKQCPRCNPDAELFAPADIPFNLSGEQIDNATTEKGEARVRALAESEARKAQAQFCDRCGKPHNSNLPHCASCHRELWTTTKNRQTPHSENGWQFHYPK